MKKQFRDFESAREFARLSGLQTWNEWREYCKSSKRTNDIPSDPNITYKNKGWISWGDFLGTGRVANYNLVFCSFTEAREFARSLNLKNMDEWREYCKSGNKPDDIPSSPGKTYKKEFKGVGDWLKNGRTRDWRSFEEAREFASKLGLKSITEWREYCKSGNKPDDISSRPDYVYKNKGWKSNRHWLGTDFRSFKEARDFARALKLKGWVEWNEYCKSGNKPDDIPSNPLRTYKNDFKGMEDWLDNQKVFRSYAEAREFARALGLKSRKEWSEYCKSGNKPEDIPAVPSQFYKNDFKGMGDWLMNGRTRDWRSFQEAREFARALNLKNYKEWNEYCKSGNKPNDIPSSPNNNYKKDFKGIGDWLGTGNVANFNKQFRPFKEAREFVRSLGLQGYDEWEQYCKSGNKPVDIPSNPWQVYSEWKRK